VFSIALPLALATISPAVPAASVTSGAASAVRFFCEEDRASFAVRAIDNAEREILASGYGLTTGSAGTFSTGSAGSGDRLPRALQRWFQQMQSTARITGLAEAIPHCSRRETQSELLPMCPFLVQTVRCRGAGVGILRGTLKPPF